MAKLDDGLAMLDNILHGKALPPHLSRSRAGAILPKSGKDANRDTIAQEQKRFNDDIAKAAAERMNKSPLLAVCINHKCRCGNSWQSFGFYARRVTLSIPGEADATFTKRLDYDPRPEAVAETEWKTEEEETCISCFGGEIPELSQQQGVGKIGAQTILRTLIREAEIPNQ